MPNKTQNSLFKSFDYAFKGIKYVLNNERNFKIHTIISLVVLTLALYFNCNLIEFALLVIVISIVLITEMINSAIEYTWDKLEPNHHPVVGMIKDVMAGVVLIASFSAIIVGLIIFVRHLFF